MKISIFGLGYVGCVSMGCLSKNGHHIIGVDISKIKLDLINSGKPTIIEKDIDELILQGVKGSRIRATKNYKQAVFESDISIISVGTPSTPNGHLYLEYIYRTAKQIGEALKNKNSFHVIAIRSTVPPGTNEKYGNIIEETSGKKRNVDFAIVSNPEFLREGNSVEDFFNPPVTVLGSDNAKALEIMSKLYENISAPIIKTEIRVAEIIKYVNNSFHALKITFANEMGNICKQLGIDSHEVMELFCMDTQLNISPHYLKPGFAYGGSCLPKDLKALVTLSHDHYLESPVIDNIEESNQKQKSRAVDMIEGWNRKKILILGISFKPGTDDLRQSPIVDVIEILIGKGYDLQLYDQNVNLSKILGQNKSYIMEKLPHIAGYLVEDLNNAIEWADIVILNNKEKEFQQLTIPEEKLIFDLSRFEGYRQHKGYEGINW